MKPVSCYSFRVVEKILNVSIRRLEVVQTQYVLDIEPDSRGVRLDVFLDDEEKNRYAAVDFLRRMNFMR